MRSGDFGESKMAESMENADLEMDQDSDSGNMEVEVENANAPTADEIERLLREADISDIPQQLIVTNVDLNVFEYETIKMYGLPEKLIKSLLEDYGRSQTLDVQRHSFRIQRFPLRHDHSLISTGFRFPGSVKDKPTQH